MRAFPIVLLLVLGLLVLVAGCAPPPPENAVPLLDAFPRAEIHRDTTRIDFGTAADRVHLGDGWSWDETSGGMSYVWATGEAADLTLFSSRARDVEATVRLLPFEVPGTQVPGTGPQTVRVLVGGREAGRWTLPAGVSEQRVRLPLVAGENTVVFRFGWHRSPAEVAGRARGGDRRSLAAAFDLLRLDVEEPLDVRVEDDRLQLGYGSEVAFYLDLRTAARLDVEEVRRLGAGELQILWQRDGEPERVRTWDGSPVPLPAGDPGRPLRVALRAVASGDGQGVVLRRPVLRVPDLPSPAPSAPGSVVPDAKGGNVLLYLVDTLRADRAGCYGQERPLTPHLDALAADGVLFERVVAQTSWTRPAVASILTGLGPVRHGVNSLESALPPAAVTLAELYREAGYRTAAFVTNDHIRRETGFDQGFDHFARSQDEAADLNERVLDWLDAESDRPFFVYVHTIDPHAPYAPRREWRERFAPGVTDPDIGNVHQIQALGDKKIDATPGLIASMLELYDAEVAQNDDAFGALRRALDERALATTIVFTSDHGEAFHEHGIFGHGWDLYDEALTIPLVVHVPGGPAGLRVRQTVQQVDLLPTLADLSGLPRPPGRPELAAGRSLLPLLGGGTWAGERPILSYMDYDRRRGSAVTFGGWKLIEPHGQRFAPGRELYALGDESSDRAAERPILAGYLASLVRDEIRFLGRGLEQTTAEIDEETRKNLEALGYLQ